MAFLELQGIQKQFSSGAIAVAGVDLAVEKGEFVSLLGPSGCGKTTTLRMIAGFERPSRGRIRVDNVDITDRPPNRRDVGMVFQSYALFPNMTVAANIGYGLRIKRVDRRRIEARVQELLGLIHLEGRGGRYPWQLSGGQQQRVALARALAIEPQLLLLDEPLSALDAKIRLVLRQEIRAIQRQLGITTIYVTHDQEEALSLSDRVVVMNEGHVEQMGPPAQVYSRPESTFVARFIGHLSVLDAHVVDAAAGRMIIGSQPIATSASLAGLATGSTLRVAVRPESLRLELEGTVPDGTGQIGVAGNVLHGSVVDVTFLGSTVRVRLKVDDTNELLVDMFNDPDTPLPATGAALTTRFPPAAVLVLDRETRNQEDVDVGQLAPVDSRAASVAASG